MFKGINEYPYYFFWIYFINKQVSLPQPLYSADYWQHKQFLKTKTYRLKFNFKTTSQTLYKSYTIYRNTNLLYKSVLYKPLEEKPLFIQKLVGLN